MSTASKITLGATTLFAAGVIVFVHYSQKVEQAVMISSLQVDLDDG
jgi:protein PET117